MGRLQLGHRVGGHHPGVISVGVLGCAQRPRGDQEFVKRALLVYMGGRHDLSPEYTIRVLCLPQFWTLRSYKVCSHNDFEGGVGYIRT